MRRSSGRTAHATSRRRRSGEAAMNERRAPKTEIELETDGRGMALGAGRR